MIWKPVLKKFFNSFKISPKHYIERGGEGRGGEEKAVLC
jgi:hypothetical protein